MSEQNEHEEIWKQIKGSEKLFEIYTYFPTFHDAKIRNVGINFDKREFFLTVDYCDLIEEPGDEVSTEITICWKNVLKADFNWYAEDLYGMEFCFEKDLIKTTFEEYSSGFDGEIVAGKIEIIDIKTESEKANTQEMNIIKLSIK